LWEAGDKNPYDDEGRTEAEMKVARGWPVTVDRDWKSGWGMVWSQLRDGWHSWA